MPAILGKGPLSTNRLERTIWRSTSSPLVRNHGTTANRRRLRTCPPARLPSEAATRLIVLVHGLGTPTLIDDVKSLRFANLQSFFSGTMNQARITAGDQARDLQDKGFALFAQDDWRLRPGLTVTWACATN